MNFYHPLEMRLLYLQREMAKRERPALLQCGVAGAPILHTVRRSTVYVCQHRCGGVG